MAFTIKLLLAGLVVFTHFQARAAITPSTNDLWQIPDINVTAASAMRGGFDVTAIFGSENSSEPGRAVFADGQPDGFVHFVEWETQSTITLTRIQLFAGGDGPEFSNQREFAQFVLKAKKELSDPFTIVHTLTPTHPFTFVETNATVVATDVTPIVAKYFRAEFVQYDSGTPFEGPRVIELDGFGSLPSATIPTSINDLWDVANGTTITASSGTFPGFHENDAFGTTFSAESGSVIFADGRTNGSTHFLEWKTATPVILTNFNLFAGGDDAIYNHEREFASFVLKARLHPTNEFETIYSHSVEDHPYVYLDPVSLAIVSASVPPVQAQFFRAEFVQWNAGRGFDGPRLVELDGYGTIVQPSISPSTNDFWDASHGATLTSSSGFRSGFVGSDAFGTTQSINPGVLIFDDNQPDGFTHFVEWTSANPFRLTGFNLFAVGDGEAYLHQREFSQFVLKAKRNSDESFTTIYTFTPDHPFQLLDATSGALLSATIPDFEAQFFRAEFVQRNVGRGFDGPRVIELDAIGTPILGSEGVVADWSFEEGLVGTTATNIVDYSGNGHHGEPVATPVYATASGVDAGSVALQLTGGSHFRPQPNDAFNFGPHDFTIEAIVDSRGANGGTNQVILSAQNPVDGGLAFRLSYRPEVRGVTFSLVTSNGFAHFVSTALPNDGNAHHIAVRRDGAVLSIYRNKQLMQAKSAFITPNFPVSGPVDLRVGADPGGQWFEGTLDRVRISRGALTTDEFIEFSTPTLRIVDQPVDLNVLAGSDATFHVGAFAAAPPAFQWFFNDSPIPHATNSVLGLTNVQLSDAGTYRAAVTANDRTIYSETAVLSVTLPPVGGPVRDDVFDVSQGNRIVSHTALFPSILPAAMFGDQSPSIEPGSLIFTDWYTNGTPHSIDWRTASPVILRGFKLFAVGDGAEYLHEREFDHFVLLAKSSPSATNYDRVIYSYQATHPYAFANPTNSLLLDVTLEDPVTAQEFRAVFTQWNAGRGYDGPRIVELDGLGDPIVTPNPVVADWDFETGMLGQKVDFVPDTTGSGHDISQVLGTDATFTPTDAATAGAISVMLPPGNNGIGNALRAPDSIHFNLGTQFTIEASVNPGSQNPTWNRGVVVGQDALTGRLVYGLDYRSETRSLNFLIVDTHGQGENVTAIIPDDGISHHVAGVYNSGTLQIYLDKVLVASKSTALIPGLSPGGAGRITLGANDIGGYWFHGILDRVRISREALAPAQFFPHRRDPGTPVTILQPLQNLTVEEGTTAAFEVIATGPGALTYQWFFNGAPIPNQVSNILVVPNVQPANAGAYKVTVTSGIWEASSTGTLTVVPPVLASPVILHHPVGRIASIGGTATFSVIAAGSPPLAYQWQFNGAPIEGATASTLVLSNLALGNAGFYSVAVSNSIGATNSAAALLTILPADNIPPIVTITSPLSGSTTTNRVTLAGSVTDNQALSHVEWLRNGQPVGPIALTNNAFTIPDLLLNTGTNVFTVRAFDLAGNTAEASVAVALEVVRSIAIGASTPVQEGARVTLPILVSSSGEIGAISFSVQYDTNYLAEPELNWQIHQHNPFTQVNAQTPGVIHATYVLPGSTFQAGADRSLAILQFRARSVPEDLSTPVTLQLQGIYSAAGDPITSGTTVHSGAAEITRRNYIGDNNANDRLDVGDAHAIIRMLTLLDPTRAWDVTGNDLNSNASLDAGDIVRVLRAIVNIDPQPSAEIGHGGMLRSSALKAAVAAAQASLSADVTRLQAGQQVRVQVSLANLSAQLSGASFRLDYPTNALRLESAAAHSAGPIIPQNAIALWNLSPDQNYTLQDGTIHFAATSADSWSSNSGALAELTFTVLEGAAAQYAWGLELQAEAASSIDIIPLAASQLILTGRDALPAELNGVAFNSSTGAFELRLIGETGVRYRVESSTDLVEWTAVQTVSDASGPILVTDPVGDEGQKFYRAIQLD